MSFTALDVETEIARMEREALREPGRETVAGPPPEPQDEHSVARLTQRRTPPRHIQGERLAHRLLAWSRAL